MTRLTVFWVFLVVVGLNQGKCQAQGNTAPIAFGWRGNLFWPGEGSLTPSEFVSQNHDFDEKFSQTVPPYQSRVRMFGYPRYVGSTLDFSESMEITRKADNFYVGKIERTFHASDGKLKIHMIGNLQFNNSPDRRANIYNCGIYNYFEIFFTKRDDIKYNVDLKGFLKASSSTSLGPQDNTLYKHTFGGSSISLTTGGILGPGSVPERNAIAYTTNENLNVSRDVKVDKHYEGVIKSSEFDDHSMFLAGKNLGMDEIRYGDRPNIDGVTYNYIQDARYFNFRIAQDDPAVTRAHAENVGVENLYVMMSGEKTSTKVDFDVTYEVQVSQIGDQPIIKRPVRSKPPPKTPKKECPNFQRMLAEAKQLNALANKLQTNHEAYEDAVASMLVGGYESNYAKLAIDGINDNQIPNLFNSTSDIEAARPKIVAKIKEKASIRALIARAGLKRDGDTSNAFVIKPNQEQWATKEILDYFCNPNPDRINLEVWQALWAAGYIDFESYKEIGYQMFAERQNRAIMAASVASFLAEFAARPLFARLLKINSLEVATVRASSFDLLVKGKTPLIPSEDIAANWLSKIRFLVKEKLPASEGEVVRSAKKGVGDRYEISNGNYFRIDKGDPNNQLLWQRMDHVSVRYKGRIIGRGGRVLPEGSKNMEDAHIPLDEWEKWRQWFLP